MPRTVIAACTIAFSAITLVSATQSVAAAPARNASIKAPAPDANGCFKTLGIKGRPHKLNTVASLSAVRLWSEAARKYGDQYTMWHNASGSSIKCQKLPNSDYHACFASGKPCPTIDAAKQTIRN